MKIWLTLLDLLASEKSLVLAVAIMRCRKVIHASQSSECMGSQSIDSCIRMG
jgi:hypothetical protein